MTLSDNSYMQTKYDLRGRIIEEIDQTGASTKYTYDNADRLISVIDANESAWTYAYDEQGNITCVTDPNGNKTSYTFDKMNRLVSTTLAEEMSDKTVYDKYGNKVSYTDFNGSTTKYTYDKYYRLSTVTYAEGTTTKYTYATNGLLSQVDFNGQVTKYEYNDLDGLKKKYLPDGTFVEYNYYTDGSLKSVTTNFGTTAYEYDILGRVSKVTDNNKGVTEYSYDAVGNLTKVVNPIKTTTEYSYDNVNRLKSEVVKASNGEVLRSYSYTLDKTGRRTKVVESGKDILNRTVEYTYDSLGRLTKEKVTENGEVSETSYTFDKVSNRLTKTENGNVTAYTYDRNNRLITEGAKTYAYDKNGNTISVTENGVTTTYTYFDFGKIRSIENNATKESYTYDHEGRRIRKESYTKATGVTENINYLLDDSGLVYNVLAEYDDTLHATTLYTYGTDIISIETNGETSYYIVDGQGSTRALTNAVCLVTDTYTYDAFGNITAQTGNTYNPYLYNQEQYDANTGLYYLRARYMDPSTGRFVSMDSYGGSIYDPTSLHKYLYANASPTVYCDPTGYEGRLIDIITEVSLVGILARSSIFGACYSFGRTIATVVSDDGNDIKTKRDVISLANKYFWEGFGGYMLAETLFWEALPAINYLSVQMACELNLNFGYKIATATSYMMRLMYEPSEFSLPSIETNNSPKYSEDEIQDILSNIQGDGFASNPLRIAYENEVRNLKNYGDKLLRDGYSVNETARILNQQRRELGITYKNMTPQPLRDYIYEVNIERYGDPLGPTYEYLSQIAHKSDLEIINSASTPNSNIDKLLEHFEEWLRNQ